MNSLRIFKNQTDFWLIKLCKCLSTKKLYFAWYFNCTARKSSLPPTRGQNATVEWENLISLLSLWFSSLYNARFSHRCLVACFCVLIFITLFFWAETSLFWSSCLFLLCPRLRCDPAKYSFIAFISKCFQTKFG